MGSHGLLRPGGEGGLCIRESFRDTYNIFGQRDPLVTVHHADVVQSSLVSGRSVEHAHTSIDRQVFRQLASCTQMKAEVVLATLHIGIGIVATHLRYADSQRSNHRVEHVGGRLQLVGNGTYSRLKRADTVVELALATTAGNREVELEAPLVRVPCSLKRGNERSVGHALKGLRGMTIIFCAIDKKIIGRRDGTGLMSILPVEAQMKAVGHECHTCGVRIDTIETDGTVTCWIAKEIDTLVCVGQNSACQCSACCRRQYCADETNF